LKGGGKDEIRKVTSSKYWGKGKREVEERKEKRGTERGKTKSSSRIKRRRRSELWREQWAGLKDERGCQ